MRVQITGNYQSDQGTVHITHERNTYRTIYSRTVKVPNLPTFSSVYQVEIGDDLAGYGYLGAIHFAGEIRSKALGNPKWVNGAVTFVDAKLVNYPIFGHFTATLHDDGSFDVVIEQWGGKGNWDRSSKAKSSLLGEPESERIETTWVRLV